MRTPEARDEARLVGERHAAAGGAENERHAAARIGGGFGAACAERRQRAGVRVDQPGADGNPRRQAERPRGVGVSPCPSAAPGATISAPMR